MYIAVLVPTLQQTHIHSDAALALHGIKPHWLAVSWHRVKALLSNSASYYPLSVPVRLRDPHAPPSLEPI
ncbi:hypothetical protein [Paraburkholderia sediminicola]|uniref:hypothetical protein n=1 Tax=Paraburkholderia sediminicola TaxID=458836 RepID=UPI0038BC9287